MYIETMLVSYSPTVTHAVTVNVHTYIANLLNNISSKIGLISVRPKYE